MGVQRRWRLSSAPCIPQFPVAERRERNSRSRDKRREVSDFTLVDLAGQLVKRVRWLPVEVDKSGAFHFMAAAGPYLGGEAEVVADELCRVEVCVVRGL